METITLTLSDAQIADLKKRHSRAKFRTDIPYSLFQVKGSDYTITVYTSKKVVFQGESVEHLILPYMDKPYPEKKPAVVLSSKMKPTFPMAGSDEVGTGDYFGPIIVCACIVTENDLPKIPVQLITDSKMIKDDMIYKIAPTLMNTLTYSLQILDNKKYNTVHKTQNLNVIKAKLHNQAYVHLQKRVTLPKLSVIDQFMPEKAYYKALGSTDDIVRNLHFETKAESKYLAVACASIIARFAFLESLKKMGTHYNVEFPKGAGSTVDAFGIDFVATHGTQQLNNVAKLHFKNTERIIQHAQD